MTGAHRTLGGERLLDLTLTDAVVPERNVLVGAGGFKKPVLVGLGVGHLTQGTLVANLGFREVAFPAPVFIGDILYGETAVLSKRLSASRAGQGVVAFQHTARDQEGTAVVTVVRDSLMRCRP